MADPESDRSVRPIEREPAFRRMADKVLTWALSLLLLLVTAIWGLTWGMTRSDLTSTKVDVKAIDTSVHDHDSKIRLLESNHVSLEKALLRIEGNQSNLSDKVDRNHDEILKELRKK